VCRTSLSEFPLVVAGAGFFGATVARRLADDYRLPVLLVEKRDHIGGNAYSKTDPATGIEYHVYGSHIFHTSNEEVWKFIGKFTRFNNYRHRVFTKHGGRVFTMPINLATINAFYGKNLTPVEARAFLAAEIARDTIPDPENLEEKAISLIGRPLYDAFVRGYTHKQWETDPRDLPAETITRLPVRLNYNDFYFSDTYEGIPLDGYARIFNHLLDHERIVLKTQCDYFDIADQLSPNAVIVYTGPVDAFYRFHLGPLGWRTLDLELERPATGDFQGTTVMNYADTDVRYTRIHEFRHYHPERRYSEDATLIMREYSRVSGRHDEPYYPINTPGDKALYDQYRGRADREPRTIFGGRLGTYRYLDMHQAIGAALKSVEHEVVPRLREFGHL
jgi:UDP-galactopyranose mutase